MLDAMLCEFEGVLADTRALRLRALQCSFAEEGLSVPDAVGGADCAALPVEDAVRAALDAAGAARDETGVALLALRAERQFAELAGAGVTLAPGAREFLEHARGRVRLALVTRAPRRVVEHVLALDSGLEAAFECIIAAEDAPASKPSPAPYRRALTRLARRRAVAVEHVLALEDGLAGLRAARAAGVRCVAIGPLPAHVQAEADAATPSLVGHTPSTLEALLAGAREEILG